MVMGLSFLDDFQSSPADDHREPAGVAAHPAPRPTRPMLERVIEGQLDELAARFWCEAVFEGFGAA